MGATPFRHIDYANHEPVTKEKLDQMQSNTQWLVDNTPVTLHVDDSYQASISSLIVVGGRLTVPISGSWAWSNVYFDGAFDSSVFPIVTIGTGSEIFKQVYLTISSLDGTGFPDSRGFHLIINVLDVYGNGQPVYVNWIAMGKRSPDYDSF